MRTIAADWSLPRPTRKSGGWLSNMGASLQGVVVGSARTARRRATRESQVSRDAFVQADVAAFTSAFMRIG
jgi:hypothetical protein